MQRPESNLWSQGIQDSFQEAKETVLLAELVLNQAEIVSLRTILTDNPINSTSTKGKRIFLMLTRHLVNVMFA